MAQRRTWIKPVRIAVMSGFAAALAGCAGTDVQINAPILEAAGINLTSKPQPEPDLEEKPPLVVPPSVDRLPEPGERIVAASDEQWPEDPDVIAKRRAAQAEKERERYCREGDWSDDANIDEFQKTIGREERCPSTLGKAVNEALSDQRQTETQTE
jgi:hypothetical protein